jgi:predicted aspartyl protease
MTASGTVVGDSVIVPEIQIGSLWLKDVEGVVAMGPLLEQSVLRRFDLRTMRRYSVEFLLLTPREVEGKAPGNPWCPFACASEVGSFL